MIGFWNHTVWPSLVGNGPEDVISLLVIGSITALLIPRVRKFISRHVASLKAHAVAENTLLHRKLDHIILHHPDIPPFQPTKGITMPFDISSIEHRFETIKADADQVLHGRVAQAIFDAARVILPLVPDGAEVEAFLEHLDHAAAEAHNLVDTVAPVVDAVAPAAAPLVADAEAATTDAQTAVAAAETAVAPPAAPEAPTTPAT